MKKGKQTPKKVTNKRIASTQAHAMNANQQCDLTPEVNLINFYEN